MSDNPYRPTGPAETAKAAAQLVKLPTLEDSEDHVTAAVEQLGAYVSSLVPGLTWTWMDDRDQDPCDPPYDQTHGQKINLRDYVASTGIPAQVWPQVLEYARQLAQAIGTTGAEVFADKPDHHDVRFYSNEGTSLQVTTRWLGRQGAAAVAGNTGCRLPTADTMTPPTATSPATHP
jgi:hypothetical protein